MKTTGIIAEYNPFHNGHLHQIKTIRSQTGTDVIVVVISGGFVQRGTPAFTDKYLRTAMALSSGADFVFELPVIYASASAGLFALGGIALLESLGFVDNVCFGSECNNINILKQAADILLNGGNSFNFSVSQFVQSGVSYPVAQHMAVQKHFPGIADQICQVTGSPNNILGIEYLKALELLKSNIIPFTIQRCGNGYNNQDYSVNKDNLVSAAAIRNAFANEAEPFNAVSSFIPLSALDILLKNQDRININEDMFSGVLYYKLKEITCTGNDKEAMQRLMEFLDVSEALAGRIIKNICNYNSFTGFAQILKTKQYTYSRVCRSLVHILLNIRTDSYNIKLPLSAGNSLHPLQVTPYARLLGMNKDKSHLLKNIQDTVLVTKTADAVQLFKNSALLKQNGLEGFAKSTFEKDIFAADLYRIISKHGNNPCPDEYRAGIIIK
ncbi:MAG: nucleotidyltransferase family protein [Lachnospiraceae bacterium]|nr:nucleotidyltransferase family protein [Lachnospiraceae bacterium]